MILNLDYERFELPGFEGVSVEMKPLEVQDYQLVFTLVQKLQDAGQGGVTLLADEETGKICAKVLPKYCRDLQGISIRREGQESQAEIGSLIKYGQFLPMCIMILTRLISSAALDQETKKN